MVNSIITEKCLICKNNVKIGNINNERWVYDNNICKECNEYILNNSPYYQAEYIKGHSNFSEKIKGILMINNFDNLKRIFFFAQNHKKITIPIESMADCNIVNEKYERMPSSNNFLNSNYDSQLFLNVTFLDDLKMESPVFLIEKLSNALKSIHEVISDFENQKYQNIQLVEVVNAIKNAKKEFDSNLTFHDAQDEILSSKIEDPAFILKKRLALGEISKEEYYNLKNIIKI